MRLQPTSDNPQFMPPLTANRFPTPALECAKSRLNPESHWLVNGSFLLTENFVKIEVL